MDLNRACWCHTAFLGTGIHSALHKMPSTCPLFASPLNIQSACPEPVHREVIDSAPLEFKCQLLAFTSLWLTSMAFCSNTEERLFLPFKGSQRMGIAAAPVLLSTKSRKPFSLKGFQHPPPRGMHKSPDYRMFCRGAFCAPSWDWPLHLN